MHKSHLSAVAVEAALIRTLNAIRALRHEAEDNSRVNLPRLIGAATQRLTPRESWEVVMRVAITCASTGWRVGAICSVDDAIALLYISIEEFHNMEVFERSEPLPADNDNIHPERN